MTSAAAYAALAGSEANPNWWHAPVASAGLAIVGVTGAVLTHGALHVVLIAGTVVVALPAAFTGVLMAVVASLPGKYHAGDDRRPEAPAMRVARRRVRGVALLVLVLAAVGGVALYASKPGVGSYQASWLLVFPILLVILVALHRRLPMSAQWATASSLALVGAIGYVAEGGPQCWNWGQFAVLPLLLLILWRFFYGRVRVPVGPWYGGSRGGPWGPP